MAYNGSGTFNLSDTVTASTTATAAEVNAIFQDLADGLTAAVAKDGQSTMTGPLKAASGSAAAPAYTFGADTNSGFYWISSDTIGLSIGGTLICTFDSGGFNLASGLTYEVNSVQDSIVSGTKMLFQQTAAPTGWTKEATHNNKALRVVTGTASSGGTTAFTSVFTTSRTVTGTSDGTALTSANMPSHWHYVAVDAADSSTNLTSSNYLSEQYSTGGDSSYNLRGTATTVDSSPAGRSGSTGSGTSHTHTFTSDSFDIGVQYVDVIIAAKD